MSVWFISSLGLCVFIALFGLYGLAAPANFRALVLRMVNPAGLIFGGVLRIALGVSLYLVAPETRWPEVLKPLGIFLIAVGAIVPLLSVDMLKNLSERILEDNEATRWVAVAVCGVLLFIVSLLLEAPLTDVKY